MAKPELSGDSKVTIRGKSCDILLVSYWRLRLHQTIWSKWHYTSMNQKSIVKSKYSYPFYYIKILPLNYWWTLVMWSNAWTLPKFWAPYGPAKRFIYSKNKFSIFIAKIIPSSFSHVVWYINTCNCNITAFCSGCCFTKSLG